MDGRLREILRWGISEPGGTGGPKGLPTSFLATVLLSPQEEVSAVLRDSLQDDFDGQPRRDVMRSNLATMNRDYPAGNGEPATVA